MAVSLGKRIHSWRRMRKLTQAELAQSAGIDQGTLSRIEADKHKPSFQTLVGLAHALRMSIDLLVDL